jgi:type I restriction enzyme M protein
MVQVMEPQLGETLFDPACGTAGFLVEAYEYLKKQCSAKDWQILQSSILVVKRNLCLICWHR